MHRVQAISTRPAPPKRGEPIRSADKRYEMALFRRYAADPTPEVREELTRRFLPLARSLAARYERRSESFDDLVQVASLGLIKAIDGFDPSRGKQFSTFAVPTILGELRRHFRDHVWNIRLPRGLQERVMLLDAVLRDLTEELGQQPTVTEIATRMDTTEEEVLEAMEASHARQTRSLDAPPSSHDETEQTVIEMLGSVDPGYDGAEARVSSQTAILEAREVNVLKMRFGRG